MKKEKKIKSLDNKYEYTLTRSNISECTGCILFDPDADADNDCMWYKENLSNNDSLDCNSGDSGPDWIFSKKTLTLTKILKNL